MRRRELVKFGLLGGLYGLLPWRRTLFPGFGPGLLRPPSAGDWVRVSMTIHGAGPMSVWFMVNGREIGMLPLEMSLPNEAGWRVGGTAQLWVPADVARPEDVSITVGLDPATALDGRVFRFRDSTIRHAVGNDLRNWEQYYHKPSGDAPW